MIKLKKDDHLVGYGMELENIDPAGRTSEFAGVGIVPRADVCEDSVVDHDLGVGQNQVFRESGGKCNGVGFCFNLDLNDNRMNTFKYTLPKL